MLVSGLVRSAAALVCDPLARLTPPLRLVLEQQAVDEGDDGVLLFGGGPGDGLEVQKNKDTHNFQP